LVRLNKKTEITLSQENNTIEVQRGQIWCNAPPDVDLKIVAAEGPANSSEARWSLSCPANSSLIAAVDRGGVEVTTAGGETQLQTPRGNQRLKSGETATIVEGEIVKSHATDPLLAADWMQPLLVRKGLDSEELAQRIDQLLARVGQAKLGTLYEEQIRALGGYAALPLLRYVQSPLSQGNPAQRDLAMRLLADLAPTWMIPDFIQLLADKEPTTRALSATALRRFTGLDQGRSPDQWREDLEQCRPTIDLWQRWWAERRADYPRAQS
jgi:hypothetical protein